MVGEGATSWPPKGCPTRKPGEQALHLAVGRDESDAESDRLGRKRLATSTSVERADDNVRTPKSDSASSTAPQPTRPNTAVIALARASTVTPSKTPSSVASTSRSAGVVSVSTGPLARSSAISSPSSRPIINSIIAARSKLATRPPRGDVLVPEDHDVIGKGIDLVEPVGDVDNRRASVAAGGGRT